VFGLSITFLRRGKRERVRGGRREIMGSGEVEGVCVKKRFPGNRNG